MPGDPSQRPGPGQATVYQIRVKGHLEDWSADGYEGMTVTLENTGDTILTVPVMDQAALYGLLRMLRDRGVPLVSINPAGPGQPRNSSTEENR